MAIQSKKKRILQISNYYPPELGGIEKIAQAISRAIEGQYEEKVICFTHDKKDKNEFIGNSEIIRCGTKLMIDSQQLSFSIGKKMKRLMMNYEPEIIIIHLPNPFTSYLVKKYIRSGTKLVVYWHSDIVKQRIGEKIFRKMILGLLERADKIVVTSPNYMYDSKYLSQYKNKCFIIPNCIDEEALQQNKSSKAFADKIRKDNDNKIICLSVGRQVPYKGFEYLIKAFKELDDRYVLYLIGRKGESTHEIERLTKGMESVYLIGEVDHDVLKGYLAACDIFCFPSITKNEAFGIALAEGMYFNKPTITFTIDGSGVNYVSVKNVTGLEVPNRNIIEYAEAIKRLAEDSELRKRLGENAGKRVRELFLLKGYANRFSALLDALENND